MMVIGPGLESSPDRSAGFKVPEVLFRSRFQIAPDRGCDVEV